MMDLVNWSLNAIDHIFSTMKTGKGEPGCPDGTFPAGYTLDSWNSWKIVCLTSLSVEDVEDLYLFGFMMAGFLLIGLGTFLFHRETKMMLKLAIDKLIALTNGWGRAANTQTQAICELNRKLDAVFERSRILDTNLEKLAARLG